jgi:hypothetical protein
MNTQKARRLSCAVAAVLALGLIIAGSALASEPYFKVESGGKVTTLGSGETRTQSFSLPAEGRMYIPALGLTIGCTNATGSGLIYNNYVSGARKEGRLKSATVSFTGCSVVEQPGCYVNGAVGGTGKITTNALTARLGYQPGSTENIEALLAPEVAGKAFATITVTECVSEGTYTIKGELVSGIGPSNTLMESSVQGVTTTTGEVQQYKSIEFPEAKEKLTEQELKFGTKGASIEGALELVLSGSEKVGYYTS